MTSIGAIVVNWNTSEHLHTCIASLLKEKITLKNIIVVDQGSTDDSVRRIRRRYPNLKILVRKDNSGYGRVVNLAIKYLDNPLVVVSNADAFLQPGCMRALSEVLARDIKVALAGPQLCDATGKNITRFSMTSIFRALLLEVIPKGLRGFWRNIEGKLYSKSTPFDVSYVEGAFMMLRRSSFIDIGGFDEGFSFFSEDADLCVRFVKSGFRVVHVPRATIMHVGGASFMQAPLRHAEEFNKNIVRYYERHAFRRALWLRRGSIVILKLKLLALKLGIYLKPTGGFRQNVMTRLNIVRTKYNSLMNHNSQHEHWTGNNPFVSVIIPTYNREESLITLLTSLRNQTYDKYEIIVVDQSEAISKKKQSVYGTFGKRLRVIRTGIANRSIAKNVGLRESSGDLILFCDDDIEPPSNFIGTHVRHHRRPDLAGVTCRFTELGLEPTQSKRICRVTFYGKMLAGYQSDTSCYVKTLAGANMSVKRVLAEEAGYFDGLLIGTSIFEEQDFSARLLRNNHKILFTNDISFPHRPQSTGNISAKEIDPARYYHDFHHNEILYFLKNRSRLCLPLVVSFCLLRTIKQAYLRGLSFRSALLMFSGVLHGFHSYYRSLR